ncbi:hypothetical protein LEMLEM_LOCUS24823, partial [Lemmus lemmus]
MWYFPQRIPLTTQPTTIVFYVEELSICKLLRGDGASTWV